jgi:hypothetical protein
VLQVGEKQVVTGFNSSRWHTVLDDAGYPKTAPPSRQAATRAPGNAANAASGAANTPAPATDGTPPPPPARGSDYPK